MKRQRGRGRKPGGGGGGNHGNRPLESNGPEVKIRGTAAQIYEKYMQYARDAQSSGDRVKYENYLQHAEHYFRIMVLTMPRDRLFQQQQEGGMPMQGQQGGEGGQPQPADGNGVTNAGGEGGGAPADALKVMDDQGEDEGDYEAEDSGEASEASEGGEEVEASDQNNNQNSDRQGRRRRRGRRNRHNDGDRGPNNDGNNDGNNGGGSALDSLARKQGALAGG